MASPTRVPIPPANSHRILWAAVWLLAVPTFSSSAQAQPSPSASAAYDNYIRSVEMRLVCQHQSPEEFLAGLSPGSPADQTLRQGGLLLENLTPQGSPAPGALLSHWRATTFVSGATASEFTSLLRDFSAYPRIFAPQVVRARVLGQSGTRARITLRMLQRHVLTVALDGTFQVTFGRLDPFHAWSASAGTSIAEIAAPNKPDEHALPPEADHGFLWRLNTWWSYEQRDGGLYLQIESVSLSRSIPFGLAWAVGPYVQSIPRDSLTFTLNAARRALERPLPAKESSSLTSPGDERN